MRLIFCFVVLITSLVYGCTDFAVQAKDGTWVSGRSLEFGLDFQSLLRVFPRKQQVVSQAPGNQEGMKWTSKYGFVGVTALGMNFPFEGLNEAGLSFGYLWMPGFTQYPNPVPGNKALDFIDFGTWTLGNFSTVAEVKEALKKVNIWGHEVAPLGLPPVHAAIHDAQGNHIVVEFVGGEMKIYDNPISVLTNSPPFDWQMTNLQNYVNLNAENTESFLLRGKKIEFQGQGNGLFGLPGDWTPPSRFVRMVTLLRFALPPSTAMEAVNLCEHMLNSVDIPQGTVREKGKNTGDYTQWVVIKDQKNKLFYYRSYKNLCLKMIDLKKLNFDKVSSKAIPFDGGKGYEDMTTAF